MLHRLAKYGSCMADLLLSVKQLTTLKHAQQPSHVLTKLKAIGAFAKRQLPVCPSTMQKLNASPCPIRLTVCIFL